MSNLAFLTGMASWALWFVSWKLMYTLSLEAVVLASPHTLRDDMPGRALLPAGKSDDVSMVLFLLAHRMTSHNISFLNHNTSLLI